MAAPSTYPVVEASREASRDRRPWVCAFAAGVALFAAVLLAASRHGIGVVRDGVSYLSAADSFASGEGLWRHDHTPYALWPPLYPVVLGTLERLGVDALVAAAVVNALGHAVATVLVFALLRLLVRDTRWVVLGTALMGLSLSSWMVSVIVASEPLFSALLVGTLLALYTTGKRRAPWDWLLPALVAALACLERYAGIVLIPTGAIALFVQREGLWRRARAAVGYALVAGVPLAAWLVRNELATGTLVGQRTHVPTAALDRQLLLLLANVGDWIVPREWSRPRFMVLAGVALPTLALLGRWWGFRARTARAEPGERAASARSGPWFGDPLVLWVFGSLALVLVMSTSTELHLIDMRLLQPVHAPLVCLAMVALDGCLRSARSPRGWRTVATVAVALVLAEQTQHMIHGLREHLAQGSIGYRSALWHDSEILAELAQRAEPELPIFTNSTPAVYMKLRRLSHRVTPGPELAPAVEELERLAPAILVCVDVESENREYPSPLAELQAQERIALELLSRRADGTIWRVTRAADPPQ